MGVQVVKKINKAQSFEYPWKDLWVSNYDVALIKLPKNIYETDITNAIDVDRTEEWPEDFDDEFHLLPESSTLSNITCYNQLLVEDPNDDLDDEFWTEPPGGQCSLNHHWSLFKVDDNWEILLNN